MFKKMQYALNDLRNPIKVRPGQVLIQQSPGRTGKSVRARKWEAKDPENRRVVDGDTYQATLLANEGFAVVLNLLPGM